MATGYGSPVGGAVIGGVAPIVYSVTGAPQSVDADVVVEWDFDNDDRFDSDLEDITSYVMDVETRLGRDWPSQLYGRVTPGQMRLTLLNDDDRFSYFNTNSPLTTGSYSLDTGRRIRLRLAESTPFDPTHLSRDSFSRTGLLVGSADELTGAAWTAVTGTGLATNNGYIAIAEESIATAGSQVAVIDVGDSNMHVQAQIDNLYWGGSGYAGLVARYIDANNYVYAIAYENMVRIGQVSGGSNTVLDTFIFTWIDRNLLGLNVDGTSVGLQVNGVFVDAATTAVTGAGTRAGVLMSKTAREISPRLFDFHVWDDVALTNDDVLWTGNITSIEQSTVPGGTKIVTVNAEGPLAKAASADVPAPTRWFGATPGAMIGNVLARARLMHPPPLSLDSGEVSLGEYSGPDGNALDMAHQFEEMERGFLFERPDGVIDFFDQDTLADITSSTWFTDTPGHGQFGYTRLSPYDHRRAVANQVTAGVAEDAPGFVLISTAISSSAAGVANHVDVTLPADVRDGDFLAVVITSSVAGNEDPWGWGNPLWWVEERALGQDVSTRVYTHRCAGTESSSVVRFYWDFNSSGGAWISTTFQFRTWYGLHSGVVVGETSQGFTPEPINQPWGRQPTAFIAVTSGIGSSSGGSLGTTTLPAGYRSGSNGAFQNGTVNGFDVGQQYAYKFDTTDSEAPTAFSGLSGFTVNESLVFAIRGYNGPFTKPTFDNPSGIGAEGDFVTLNDVESQRKQNAILSYTAASNLFSDRDDAERYAGGVLEDFARARPVLSLTFVPTSSSRLRQRAGFFWPSDVITVTSTGDSGYGVEGDFRIDTISHRISDGGKYWECTLDLSPV